MDNNYNPNNYNSNTENNANSNSGTTGGTGATGGTGTTGGTGATGTSGGTSDSLYSYSYVNQKREENRWTDPSRSQQNGWSETNQSQQQNGWNETHQSQQQNRWNETSQSQQQNSWNGTNQSQQQNSWGETSQSQQNGQYYTPYNEPKHKKKQPKEKKKGGFGMKLAKCAAIALVFGLVSGTVFHGTGMIFDYATGNNSKTEVQQGNSANVNNKVTTTSASTKAVVSDISEVVKDVMPSIVSITSLSVQEVQVPFWFGDSYTEETPSAGSGIIVAQTEDEIHIATNNHVVSGATTLTVTFVNDESVSAEIKGTDSSTDLAVISVKISDIPEETMSQIKVATLGDSDSLQVGEPAVAIGNAMGYGQSVTTGVISALNREVTVTDSNGNAITNSLIQTDAAINPGNSGGALLNINGEVIGINSVKYSDTDVEGMGYAIPMSMAEPIINDLITKEVVDESESAYLGVSGVDVTDEVSETYNMPKGIYVAQVVSGSAAEQAGIKKGDIITEFDGREVDSMNALAERMQYYAAGTTVDVTVKVAENGEYVEKTISVTLGKKN